MAHENDLLMQILDEHHEIAFAELLGACELDREELIELIEYGVLRPSGGGGGTGADWRFPSRTLTVVRRAARLRSGLELDTHALAVMLGLLEELDTLERRVRELECQLLR